MALTAMSPSPSVRIMKGPSISLSSGFTSEFNIINTNAMTANARGVIGSSANPSMYVPAAHKLKAFTAIRTMRWAIMRMAFILEKK
jgi:hypothetical protein